MEKKNMITLKSSDNEIFEIEEAAAMQSKTIRRMIEDCFYDSTPIPVPNVSSYIEWIVEYCHCHDTAAVKESSVVIASDFKKFNLEIGDGIDWDKSNHSISISASSAPPRFSILLRFVTMILKNLT